MCIFYHHPEEIVAAVCVYAVIEAASWKFYGCEFHQAPTATFPAANQPDFTAARLGHIAKTAKKKKASSII